MEPGYGEVRLSESVVVETVTAIGVQMTHQMVFQAGGDCGDGLDENDEQQAEEWLVHRGSLIVSSGKAMCLSTVLVPRMGADVEPRHGCLAYNVLPSHRR